jgi:hypothetical protein
LGQHSRHFWSSEGSTVYKHQKLTLQRALCSCGPTSVAGLKPLRVSRYCQNARNQAVSPARRRRATGAEPANSQGSHIVKKPRAHSAVAMGAIVSIEIAVFLDHLRRFDEPHIDRALVVATAVAFAITS